MLKTKQIKKHPFVGGKFNVTPDDEMCKTCGKCCNEKFGYMTIIPYDFNEKEMEDGLRWLMKRKLLFVKLYNANFDGGYYEPIILQLGKCYFLKEDGCVLPSDERPLICTHYGPKRFTKKGKPRKHIVCGFQWSDWIEQVTIDKYGSKYAFWEMERWDNHTEILSKLFDELPPNRKVELHKTAWGIKIVNAYESVGVLYEEVKVSKGRI